MKKDLSPVPCPHRPRKGFSKVHLLVKVLRIVLLALLVFLASSKIIQAQDELILLISAESQYINLYQSTGILASVTTRAGEAVQGQEITFSTDKGTVKPNQVVTNSHGEVWITYTADGLPGISHVTASFEGHDEMIEINVALSTLQWIVIAVLALLIAGVTIILYRHRRKINHDQL